MDPNHQRQFNQHNCHHDVWTQCAPNGTETVIAKCQQDLMRLIKCHTGNSVID
nr:MULTISPECIES: hypothetical protein [Providencia]ELR5252347.1 hypothetical protein [Providencia rettgeri]